MSDNNEAESTTTAHRQPPPVTPAEMMEEFSEGVLFSDPELTAWWWNSHDFMTNRQRHEMAQQILPLCTSQRCREMFKGVNEELTAYFGPVSTGDALMTGLKNMIAERPYFCLVIAAALSYLLIVAGMNLFEVSLRLGSPGKP